VLIVADDHDPAESLAVLLRTDGHRVDVVPSGATALARAQVLSLNRVIPELGLPWTHGWKLASRVREWPEPTVPLIVAVTAKGQALDRRKSDRAGIDLHLVKPADPQQLRRLLAALLRRANEEDPLSAPVAARSGETGHDEFFQGGPLPFPASRRIMKDCEGV
jgi:hypothetical protein